MAMHKVQHEKTFCPLSVHTTKHRLMSLKTKQNEQNVDKLLTEPYQGSV